MPIVPTPAAARYSAAGDPSPPAPMSRTFAASSLRCPTDPTSGKMMCRAYRRAWSSDSAVPFTVPLCAVPFVDDDVPFKLLADELTCAPELTLSVQLGCNAC